MDTIANLNPTQMRSRLRNEILSQIDLRPFIDGSFHDVISDEILKVKDPYLLETLVEMPVPGIAEADHAISVAHHAFLGGVWSRTRPNERAACLTRLADLIEQHIVDLSLLETSDTGRLLSGVSAWEIPHAAQVYRYYAGFCDKVGGQMLPSSTGSNIEIRQDPVGVSVLLVPWNFPFACIAWKMAPALAAGCTVVVKTPERTPLAAQYLASLVMEAGFPPGVVNILTGQGSKVGARLVQHPKTDKVSFTGSTETGRSVVRASADHFPSLSLELGGKSANLIFADADIESAALSTIGAMFGQAGQDCCAGSRTYVHESISKEFTRRLVELAEARKLGDPMDYTTEQGPQIDLQHVARIDGFVTDATAKGAYCSVGGKPRPRTCFYEPTILEGVHDDMRVSREEVFGPVSAVYTFTSEDEAFQMANATEYGLAAGIWTSDRSRVERFLTQIRVGTVWVNAYGSVDITAPWGGRGYSGYGSELGEKGFEEYLRTSSVFW